VRTSGGGLNWLAADHHATGQLSINAGDLSVNRRKSDPFGNPRGTQPSWPTNHGYVNGITDPTGLTHLGAREYDPGIGRFISVDPILDLADPVQMNGYNYANNSPVSSTDPSGLRTCSDPTDCAGDPTKGNPGYGNGATEESSVPGYHKPRTSTGNGRGKGSGKGRGGWKDAGCHSVSCSIHPRTKEEERAANHFAARIGSWLPFLDVAFLYWERELYEEEGNKKAVTETDDLIMTTELLGAGLVPGGAVRLGRRGVLAKAVDVCHSFDPRTPVLMADGSQKSIKDVKVGDKVKATNPDNGKLEEKPVTQLHLNRDTDLVDLTVRSAAGATSTLHTTVRHPFWNETRHEWTEAASLRAGDQLHPVDAAEAITVQAVHPYTGTREMRDLTVADVHTYYVMAGNTPVLVHNCGGEVSGSAAGQKLANQLRLESANSLFTADGGLTSQAINESRLIIRGSDLGNRQLRAHLTRDGSDIADWGKYTTRTHHSPSGDFQVHYYYNPTTGAVAYDFDYKVVMNAR